MRKNDVLFPFITIFVSPEKISYIVNASLFFSCNWKRNEAEGCYQEAEGRYHSLGQKARQVPLRSSFHYLGFRRDLRDLCIFPIIPTSSLLTFPPFPPAFSTALSLLESAASRFRIFLDASTHLYKRVCPSVGPWSVGPSVSRFFLNR